MGSIRSWVGSILSISAFLLVRSFTAGLAAPTFLAVVIATLYAWTFVLRVPEFKKPVSSKPCGGPESRGVAEPVAKEAAAPAAVPAAEPAAQRIAESGVAQPTEPTAEPVSAPATHEALAGTADANGEPAAPSEQIPSVEPTAAANGTPCAQEPANGDGDAAVDAGAAAADVLAAAAAESGGAAEVPAAAAHPATAEEGVREEAANDADSDEGASTDEGERQRRDEAEYVDPDRAKELRVLGNDFFKAGRVHDAREAYSEALHLTPSAEKKERAVLFCNRAACQQKVGRWAETVNDCTQAIQLDPQYVKAYCRRSTAYEQQSKWHDAVEDLKRAIELDPPLRSKEYKRQAILEARAQEQFEKDKTEMMSKLKDLGNTVLGKFGMSVDNFKMEQDPNTGSYSVKYNG